jgi:glycosyltransferase involved in cell wall biosynthesis
VTRLLCLTSWYPPHHYGGYETGCYDVMARLEARGHHVEVLCSDERLPGVRDAGGPHEAHVHRTLRLYHRGGDLWAPPRRRRLAVERHNQAALTAALDAAQPDVVAVWHVGAMSVGLLSEVLRRGLPVVYCVQDLWPAYAVKLDAWLRLFAWSRPVGRVVERLTGVPATVPDLDAAGGFCFISQLTRRQARAGSRWSFPRSGVVYSGIEPARFRTPGGPHPERWEGRLLYVGRLDPRKGIDTALRALAALPGATLSVIGRGPDAERDRLGRLAGQLGVEDRVTFGEAERSELAAVYAAADALVFPSEWQEPFGLVPLEAMAAGVPVVATADGGSAEFLVDGQNCLVFPPGDDAALVAAIGRLAGDAELRRALVEAGTGTAAFFDIEHVVDAFEAWHAAAIAGFPDGPLPDRTPPGASSGREARQ